MPFAVYTAATTARTASERRLLVFVRWCTSLGRTGVLVGSGVRKSLGLARLAAKKTGKVRPLLMALGRVDLVAPAARPAAPSIEVNRERFTNRITAVR